MSEPEAVTRARRWIPLHRENRYQKLATQIMTDLLAAYDELVAEVERLRDVKAEWRMYCIRAESERDQLKAAVERVRAEAEAYACQPGVLEPCGAVAQGILAALDGDDQSGDPCCGDLTPRTFRGVAGEHSKCLSCGTPLGTPQSGDPS